jgi:hypothetical protein
MGQSSIKASENKEYIASDRWKCEKSPSGAHYWIIQSYQMTCKYCSYHKEVNPVSAVLPKPEVK